MTLEDPYNDLSPEDRAVLNFHLIKMETAWYSPIKKDADYDCNDYEHDKWRDEKSQKLLAHLKANGETAKYLRAEYDTACFLAEPYKMRAEGNIR